MVIDFEITLNRFGLYRPAVNKVQLLWLRVSWWTGLRKWAVSVEINWKMKE